MHPPLLLLLDYPSSHGRSRLFSATLLLRKANGLVGSEDCLLAQPEQVCNRATEAYGMVSRPGFIKVGGVAVVAVPETCYAAVSEGWQTFIDQICGWCKLLLVLGGIESTVLLCVGYCANVHLSCEYMDGHMRPTVTRLSSAPDGATEACLVLGFIFTFPVGPVYLVRVRNCVLHAAFRETIAELRFPARILRRDGHRSW
jgi:hypothetical protein